MQSIRYRDFVIFGQTGYLRYESLSGGSVSSKHWKTVQGVKKAIDREYPDLPRPKCKWVMGYQLPANDLVKAVSHAHVVAVQEYDHVTAEILENFIRAYATRYEVKGASNE